MIGRPRNPSEGAPHMTPKTLLEMAGADMTPPALADAVLVLIDCQNEYVSGDLPLVGVDVALDHLTGLLDRAREAGTPVVHVRHKGQPGSLFDLDQARGAIHPAVAPREGELVIDKRSEEHTSELQSLMRISYAVFC